LKFEIKEEGAGHEFHEGTRMGKIAAATGKNCVPMEMGCSWPNPIQEWEGHNAGAEVLVEKQVKMENGPLPWPAVLTPPSW